MPHKIALCLLAVVAVQQAQSLDENEVDGARPLFAALNRIQATRVIPINYEDPPFLSADDSIDVTEKIQSPQQRAANPHIRIRIPRGGSLAWGPIPIRPGNVSDALPLVVQLIEASERKGFPGKFKVLGIPGGLSVAPTACRNERGEWTSVTPVMATEVSIEARDRTVAELIESLLQQIGQRRGIKVGLASGPVGMLASTRTSIGASGQPAGSVLAEAFLEITRQAKPATTPMTSLFSYALLFDPGRRYYLLSVIPLPATSQADRVPPATSIGRSLRRSPCGTEKEKASLIRETVESGIAFGGTRREPSYQMVISQHVVVGQELYPYAGHRVTKW